MPKDDDKVVVRDNDNVGAWDDGDDDRVPNQYPDPLNQHEREVRDYPNPARSIEFREIPPDLKILLSQNYAIRMDEEIRPLSSVECAEQLLWEAQETEKAEKARVEDKEKEAKEAQEQADRDEAARASLETKEQTEARLARENKAAGITTGKEEKAAKAT